MTWSSVGSLGGSSSEALEVEQVPGDPTSAWVVGYTMRVQLVTDAFGARTVSNRTGDLLAQGWPNSVAASSVAVVDANTVAIGGANGWMAKTTDAGTSWTVYQLPGVSLVNDIDLGPAGTVWAATDGSGTGNLWRSTTATAHNAGAWTQINIGSGNAGLRGVVVPDATHGYAVGNNGMIYSWNGTTWTWRTDSTLEIRGLYGVASPPGQPAVAVAVGEMGSILRTSDSGATWGRIASPTGDTLYGGAAGSGALVAVGNALATARSTDAGVTWTHASDRATARSRWSVATNPTDGRIAIAAGSRGTVWRTTDGGASWTSIATSTTQPLFAVAFGSSAVAWAAGAGGTIVRSLDGGLTWNNVTSGTTERLLAVTARDDHVALAVGEHGTVARTVNGGATFSVASVASGRMLTGVSLGSPTVAVIVGVGTTLRSTDTGATWVAATTVPDPTARLTGVSMADSTYGYIASEWGAVWRTTDGGVTWSSRSVASAYPKAVSAASRNVAYAILTDVLYATRDGGTTWQVEDASLPYSSSVAAVDGSSYVVTGIFGRVEWRVQAVSGSGSIPDYGAAPNGWAPSSQAMFGVCLQSMGGAAAPVAPWVPDADTCTASDSDPWQALPAAPTTVGRVLVAGGAGSADFVFGIRFPPDQAPGLYTAGVVFEAVAPSV